MAFLIDKNQLFFKDEGIQCSMEDKHVFLSPFVFPKPTINQKQEAIGSKKAIIYYDERNDDYKIKCALYHVEKDRFKIRKYLEPLNTKSFVGIHLITGSFQSPEKSNIFHFKGFSCDFYVSELFEQFSPNEIFYIVTHLFERKERHNMNYFDALVKYISNHSLVNNKTLTFERLQEPFSKRDILEYGLVHLEHRSTKYHTEKNTYCDTLIAQLKEPISFDNGNVIKAAVLVHDENDDLYKVNFLKGHIFNESHELTWKKRKGVFYTTNSSLMGIILFKSSEYINERKDINEINKFSPVFSFNFTFFPCIENSCSFAFKHDELQGEVHQIYFGEFLKSFGLDSTYYWKENNFMSSKETDLESDISYALSLNERDIVNNVIQSYKFKKDSKEEFLFQNKILDTLIEDPLYLEQENEDDFQLLMMNYQDIELLIQYINFTKETLLKAFSDAYKSENRKQVLKNVSFALNNKIF